MLIVLCKVTSPCHQEELFKGVLEQLDESLDSSCRISSAAGCLRIFLHVLILNLPLGSRSSSFRSVPQRVCLCPPLVWLQLSDMIFSTVWLWRTNQGTLYEIKSFTFIFLCFSWWQTQHRRLKPHRCWFWSLCGVCVILGASSGDQSQCSGLDLSRKSIIR